MGEVGREPEACVTRSVAQRGRRTALRRAAAAGPPCVSGVGAERAGAGRERVPAPWSMDRDPLVAGGGGADRDVAPAAGRAETGGGRARCCCAPSTPFQPLHGRSPVAVAVS
jgi:hypothetical protein